MKVLVPQSRQFKVYSGIFLSLFILFAGFQFFLHQHFVDRANYPHFLGLLRYPPETGRHKGFNFPGCPEGSHDDNCPTAIDGTLLCRNDRISQATLGMMEGISPELPCRSTVGFNKRKGFTFRIHFAGSAGKEYFLTLNESSPDESGVFLESEAGLRKLLDLTDVARSTVDSSSLEVTIDCRKDSFLVTLGSRGFEHKVEEPIDRVLLKIDQLPSTDDNSRDWATLVDRVAVKEIRGDGPSRTIAVGDFHNVPLFFNLPAHSGFHQDSRATMFLAFLLLAVAAFLVDWLLALTLTTGVLASMSMSGLFFVLLPFQGVILSLLRASLALPFIQVLYCICMLAIAKFILILRYGLVASPLRPSQSFQRVQIGLLGLGMALYGIVLVNIWGELTGEYHFSQSLATLFVSTPPLVILGGILSARAYPGMLWFALVAQFFSVYFLQNFYNIQEKTPFFMMVLILWILGTCVHALRFPRRRAIVLQVYLYTVLIVLLGYTEVLIRGVPTLNSRFSRERSVTEMWKDPERIPALFPNRARPDELEFTERLHRIKKQPDLFRIVCLGSSSTEGVGAPGKYSYPAQLERILDQSSLQKVEVINGGISGAPFFLLLTHLKEVFMPMDPDLVIIYFGNNGDSLEPRLLYDRMKREVAEAPFIESAEELWAAMHLKWNPPWMIRGFLGLARLRTFMAAVLIVDQLRSAKTEWAGGVQKVPLEESLEEAVGFSVKQGITVLLVPEVQLADARIGSGVISSEYSHMFERIADQYSGQDVYYQDVLDHFSPETADSCLIDSVHMNDDGYHLLAEKIAGFLLEEGIIARK